MNSPPAILVFTSMKVKALLEWIKSMLERIKSVFRRKAIPTPATELEKRLGVEIQNRKEPETRRPYPNMPKRQPCPLGHGWKRRGQKTMNGAGYHCNTCQQVFFVRAR